ncbi:ribonuclease H-like domain-containing protein [Cytidiella melzeri]|nr:ribonuclease H-like domain-containing protein [Cytidiella melzeri]
MSKTDNIASSAPSSNWLALQKVGLTSSSSSSKPSAKGHHPRIKRKIDHDEAASDVGVVGDPSPDAFPRGFMSSVPAPSTSTLPDELKNRESVALLRKMISGNMQYTDAQKLPGKYLALDCEMVGVGIDGKESSLARVSLVNFYGVVLLDEFVRQREHVVDYRTEFSGIRPKDMIRGVLIHHSPFAQVQQQVADLLKDRILVGHAVHNDLKALLLSHPYTMTRDTQILAFKHKVMKTKRPALRHLVQQEVGVAIQGGEHSSVTDARATMAVYRIHRKAWEKGFSRPPTTSAAPSRKQSTAQKGESDGEETNDAVGAVSSAVSKRPRNDQFPRGGRKGVSSGLSVVVQRKEKKTENGWWKDLGGGHD